MKKGQIFIGNISKNTNRMNWNKLNLLELTKKYMDLIGKDIILVQTKEHEYVPLENINSLTKEILISLGLYFNSLKTTPNENNPYFIDEKTLEPFFGEDERNHPLSLKKLKKEHNSY